MTKRRVLTLTLLITPLLLLSIVLFGQPGAKSSAAFAPDFGTGTFYTDVTHAAGLTATHTISIDYLIAGQAWGDYDQDGWLDLYVTDSIGPNTLFRNTGRTYFTVSPINSAVTLSDTISGGAVFGDFNNDGWPDLYVLNRGANVLFRNEMGLGFTDVTASAGVGDTGKGETGAWGDYDGDGYLDLYVANWACDVQECPAEDQDRLYHNNGDETFTDVTSYLAPADGFGPGFTGSFVDYDNDGDLDIYVVIDKLFGNNLFRNEGPGCGHWCFTNVAATTGANTQAYAMGLGIGDYDNDLDLDLYFTDIGPMTLLQNQTSQGSDSFIDVSAFAGVNFDAVGWGAVFFDYDNDGWLDLLLATSNIHPDYTNRLYNNKMDGTFADVTIPGLGVDQRATLGVAYADYDYDGRVDVVFGDHNIGYPLFRNEYEGGGDWLQIKLIGRDPVNWDGIGARVYLETSGGRSQMQEVKSGSSLGAGNSTTLHFGLGSDTIDSLRVLWPDGTEQLIAGSDVPVNQLVPIVYPDLACTASISLSGNQSGETFPEGTVIFDHLLTNSGNCDDYVVIGYDSTSDWPGIRLPRHLFWLPAGGSSVISLEVHAPGGYGIIDSTTIRAISGRDMTIGAETTDTTTIIPYTIFVPVIRLASGIR